MSKKTLYAAKVNVNANIFSYDLDEIITIHIPRVILEAPSIKINSYTWSFTDVKELISSGERFITGNVTKSKKIPFTARIGTETTEIIPEHEQAKTAYFAYHPKSEILTYEVNSYVTDIDFRNVFTKLLSRDVFVGEVKIMTFPEPFSIRNEFTAIDKITSVSFHLIHPNPGKKEFDLYQALINQNQAKEADIRIVNPTGLRVTEPSLQTEVKFVPTIENGIAMVESGYGTVVIRGFDEVIVPGEKKKKIKKHHRNFSSVRSIRKITVNDFGEERLLSRVRSFILDIIKNIQNKD